MLRNDSTKLRLRFIRNYPCIVALLFVVQSYGQSKEPENYGFRHLQINYKGNIVDILIKAKKGDEQKRKPLFLFCQGSLPIPLIITYKDSSGAPGTYNTFPFNPDDLSKEYHLAVVNKPGVPLISEQRLLKSNLTYTDSTGRFPSDYIKRNLLDFYVHRNIAVIKFLQNQPWVSNDQLIVAGHSEGSTIAAKLAYTFTKVTQLIYSGGNPCGRIVTMIAQQRSLENDSTRYGEQVFNAWEKIIANPTNMDASKGDAYKATYGFSKPAPMEYLEKLKIPVLVTYGTRDYSGPFNDYFRVRIMGQKKTNFSFKAYTGVEHNFFPLKANGETNFDIFNWDKVAGDWRQWLIGRASKAD